MPEASLQALVHTCLNDVAAARSLSPHQWQVCHHIAQCRTAALGGFALECGKCQGSCRINHVASASDLLLPGVGFPGLSRTEAGACQLRVVPDQRAGLAALAAW